MRSRVWIQPQLDTKREWQKKADCILSSIMRIQVLCAPEFHNDFWLFFKNNFTRINHCKFIQHKSHLKLFLSYLPCIVHREYLSTIFNVKKCTLYSIKYGKWILYKNILTNFVHGFNVKVMAFHNILVLISFSFISKEN